MTRILIFYDYFSPAFKAGGPIRSLNNLVELIHTEGEFFVFTASEDLDGTSLAVETDTWVPFKENVQVFYASKGRRTPRPIYQAFLQVKPDTVYINGLFTPYAVLFPLAVLKVYLRKEKLSPRIVLAPRGMLQKGALALKAGKKRVYLDIFKLLGLHKGLLWHATDAQEHKDIVNFAGAAASVQVISNVPIVPTQNISHPKKHNTLRLVSVSLLVKMKNLHFVLACIAQLHETFHIVYDIYGPIKDGEYWHYLQQEIEKLPQHITVEYKGTLAPEQVVSTIRGYDCFVLPTLGENFGHAIFEALGCGVPVLISDKTPWQHLEKQQAGWDLPLEKSLWIDALHTIAAMSQEEFKQWQEGAYAYAVTYLEHQNLKTQYLQLLGISQGNEVL